MLDKKPMREKSASKRQMRNISKSSTSLNSLDSNEDDDPEVRTKSHPQTVEMLAESIVCLLFELVSSSQSVFDYRIQNQATPKKQNLKLMKQFLRKKKANK